MEEARKMHSEDDKVLLEKNKKRKVKIRAQVQALEKFYSESIGLTEKQVSGWFCHCRLKDKRLMNGDNYATGRQDRSSGAIQDRDSGHRQDSCSSTKQGDDRNFDTREVESTRLTLQECSAVKLTCEHGSHTSGNHNRMDDASSGSSSSLRNMSSDHNVNPFDVPTSRYLIPKFPMDATSVKTRRGPLGYLKVKGQVENTTLTAIKRQLEKHYREYGRPLDIKFDPLPPGAFESSMQSPVDETFYTGETALPASPDFSKVHQHPKFGKGFAILTWIEQILEHHKGQIILMIAFSQRLNSILPCPTKVRTIDHGGTLLLYCLKSLLEKYLLVKVQMTIG